MIIWWRLFPTRRVKNGSITDMRVNYFPAALLVSIVILLMANALLPASALAYTSRFRCMWRTDPATTMVIGWDQVSGSRPVLYYDVVDHGQRADLYAFRARPSRQVAAKGMHNHFVRLEGLRPNTVYYFVVSDNEGTSARYSFRTAPDNPRHRLSIIAGGDSRNNRQVRQSANRLVAKLRPHCVFFAGDMTGGDTDPEWRNWFDDWQLTISQDGRIYPIVAARGNHESSNQTLVDLFDVPSQEVYYALTLGRDLLRIYTLNTLIATGGDQRDWLNDDLARHQDVRWRLAQYHHPMRPHTARKPELNNLIVQWGQLFYRHRVQLAIESDAHVVKTTYPIRPSNGPSSDEGFIRDDAAGTVYIGEGCWGAPLRANNDDKSWTRASGSFNQFRWIFISKNELEIRTIKNDVTHQVEPVDPDNIFDIPKGLVMWQPAPGEEVLTIKHASVAVAAQKASPDETERPIDKAKPLPPDEWDAFSKLLVDMEQRSVRYRYELADIQPVTAQLFDQQQRERCRERHLERRSGVFLQEMVLPKLPAGRYLLAISTEERVIKYYQVIVPDRQ